MRYLLLVLLLSVSAAHAQFKAGKPRQSVPEPVKSDPVLEKAAEPEPTPPPSPVVDEGYDSKWRPLIVLGAGSLSPRGENSNNTLERDYKDGGGATFGVLMNYRSQDRWGLEFGLKVLAMTREAKNANLNLTLTYLALPFEYRYKIANISKRSSFYMKAGLTYLLLLTANVGSDGRESDGSGESGDDWDWDDWDAYPSPPTKGQYRGSFNKSDFLASLGAGFDIMLFQTRGGFNMSLLPELVYYRGLTNIAKSGEFGGEVRNEGALINLSVAFGF